MRRAFNDRWWGLTWWMMRASLKGVLPSTCRHLQSGTIHSIQHTLTGHIMSMLIYMSWTRSAPISAYFLFCSSSLIWGDISCYLCLPHSTSDQMSLKSHHTLHCKSSMLDSHLEHALPWSPTSLYFVHYVLMVVKHAVIWGYGKNVFEHVL